MAKEKKKREFEIWDRGTNSNPRYIVMRNGKGFCQAICGNDEEHADFIARACTSHEALVDALKAIWASHAKPLDSNRPGKIAAYEITITPETSDLMRTALALAKKGT